MTSPEDGQPGASDVVQFGRSPRRRPRWLGPVLLACLAAAAVVAVVARSSSPHAEQLPPPSPPLALAPAVINVGHPILGIHAGWELFGLAGSDVVAVQFAKGRMVRWAFRPLASGGPVSFVVTKDEVIVRPLDYVQGYRIPDGKPARPLTGILAQGGTLLPGPSPSQEWFHQGGSFRTVPAAGQGNWLKFDPASVQLIGSNGKPAGLALPMPSAAHAPVFAMADGRGNVVLVDGGGAMYDAGPGLLRPVGAQIIAIGPTNWLAMRCARGTCRDVVINPATGTSKALPGQPITATPWTSLLGVVAPNGGTAAVVVTGRAGTGPLELINLGTGAVTRVDPLVGFPSYQQLAWSPDGAWLFAVTARGTLAAISIRTGRAENLGLGVSGLSQIAIRPTSG